MVKLIPEERKKEEEEEKRAFEVEQEQRKRQLDLDRRREEFKARQRGRPPEEVTEEILEEKGPELAEKFGEAGVFEEPTLEPIIPQELEDQPLAVLGSIVKSILPEFEFITAAKDVLKRTPTIEEKAAGEARAVITETEAAIEEYRMGKILQSEIGKEYDNQIEETVEGMEIYEFGIGVGTLAALAGGVILGNLKTPFEQFIGSDKKVKNLETGIEKLASIGADISSTVKEGSMSVDEGLARLQYIDIIINNLEGELQLAAIESANVRISLKGRSIAIKLLYARQKQIDAKRKIAGFEIAGLITPSPAHQKAVILEGLKEKYKK